MSAQAGKKSFSKRLLRLVSCVLVCVLGAMFLLYRIHLKHVEAEAVLNTLVSEVRTGVPVDVMEIVPSDWESWKSYYGRARATRMQEVTSYVREIVDEVFVDIGDEVEAGQVLLTLLKKDHAINAQAKMSVYEEARLNYSRLEELYKQKVVAKAELDKAYALMKSEEANAVNFASTLERTEIRARIGGIVTSRNVEAGEIAVPDKSLLTIVDPAEMEATLLVSKKHVAAISRETPVEIRTVNGFTNAWVKRVSPKAEDGSGLYPVIVGIDPKTGILPGMYIEGNVLVHKEKNVAAIPSASIVFRGKKQYVYTVTPDGKGLVATLVEVTLGDGANEKVVVASGLHSGELLITSGNRGLSDGIPVFLSNTTVPDNGGTKSRHLSISTNDDLTVAVVSSFPHPFQ